MSFRGSWIVYLYSGKEVYIPFCPITGTANSEMSMLHLKDSEAFSSLLPNRWGVREFSVNQVSGLKEGVCVTRLHFNSSLHIFDPIQHVQFDVRFTATSCFLGLNQSLDLILVPGMRRGRCVEVKGNPSTSHDPLLFQHSGLGFDQSGGRLGHGKGYYDKYISAINARSACPLDTGFEAAAPPLLVGLALREQILPPSERVPTSEHDHCLNIIIGPNGPILPQSSYL